MKNFIDLNKLTSPNIMFWKDYWVKTNYIGFFMTF